MSSMTHVTAASGGDEDGDGDDDEGLAVATVDLAGLQAILVKHRVSG